MAVTEGMGRVHRYELHRHWGETPSGWERREVSGVAVDSRDNVFVFARQQHPVMVYDSRGRLLDHWGEGLFQRPHAISVAPDGTVLCVDDWGHTVFRFSPDGRLRQKLERLAPASDYPSPEAPGQPITVTSVVPPFNFPTGAAMSRQGNLFVSDGYGNARVHVFDSGGKLIYSWGEPGGGPGQFNLPHGIAIDQHDRVYVSDRMNARVQVFNLQGEFIAQWPARWPNNVAFGREGEMYVAELGGVFVFSSTPDHSRPAARVTVRTPDGDVISEILEESPYDRQGFFAPHSVAVDSTGDLYVGDVSASYSHGQAPSSWSVLRKYVRVA
jgi:6-bladed beta-propeller